tara:strand:+ start:684 stop:848 length:165 start_codon:yes stop_codon:yes gene_type:complete
MAISRAQMGKQVRNGPSRRSADKSTLTLPPGVKSRPKTMTRVMRQAMRQARRHG